jgi:hypothetical protein
MGAKEDGPALTGRTCRVSMIDPQNLTGGGASVPLPG